MPTKRTRRGKQLGKQRRSRRQRPFNYLPLSIVLYSWHMKPLKRRIQLLWKKRKERNVSEHSTFRLGLRNAILLSGTRRTMALHGSFFPCSIKSRSFKARHAFVLHCLLSKSWLWTGIYFDTFRVTDGAHKVKVCTGSGFDRFKVYGTR